MALNVANLISDIKNSFDNAITYPYKSSETVALNIAENYHDYASLAQSCAGLTPTVVDYSGLQTALVATFGDPGQSASEAALEWSDAFYGYWEGAHFGATGAVATIAGKTALKTALQNIFENTSQTAQQAATNIGNALNTFTKTVNVQDTAVPPPSGCGPLPIS